MSRPQAHPRRHRGSRACRRGRICSAEGRSHHHRAARVRAPACAAGRGRVPQGLSRDRHQAELADRWSTCGGSCRPCGPDRRAAGQQPRRHPGRSIRRVVCASPALFGRARHTEKPKNSPATTASHSRGSRHRALDVQRRQERGRGADPFPAHRQHRGSGARRRHRRLGVTRVLSYQAAGALARAADAARRLRAGAVAGQSRPFRSGAAAAEAARLSRFRRAAAEGGADFAA